MLSTELVQREYGPKFTARLGENVVFTVEYNSGGAHSTRWMVDPSKSIQHYTSELGMLLDHLIHSQYRPTLNKAFPIGIMHVRSQDGDWDLLPLEDLLGEPPRFVSNPDLSTTIFLRINTLHADYGMESDLSEAVRGKRWPFEPWTPEKGYLFLITNDPDLCDPVAGLISRTSRLNVPQEQIVPALREAYALGSKLRAKILPTSQV